MSLYEFLSTAREYAKLARRAEESAPPSDESYEAIIDRLRALNLPDVVV